MEIRPILSAMWRNRTGSVLVAVQIALTLAIVVNCMFLAKNRIDFMSRPSGMDVDNIIYAQSIGFGMDYDHDATIDADLALLRELPGVIHHLAEQAASGQIRVTTESRELRELRRDFRNQRRQRFWLTTAATTAISAAVIFGLDGSALLAGGLAAIAVLAGWIARPNGD